MTALGRLFVTVLLLTGTVFADEFQPRIEPPDPTSTTPVTLIVFEGDSCPPEPVVTRTSFQIDVVLGTGPCLSPPTLITHRIALGLLPPGTYTVSVTDGGAPAGSLTFVVLDASNDVIVRPSLGPARGGTVVNIRTSVQACIACPPPAITFGGVPATDVTIVDELNFRATTPAHEPGPVEVRVTGETGTRSSFAFRYYDPDAAPFDELFERILIPVVYNGPGAHGSIWATELTVRNANVYAVEPWRGSGTLAVLPAGTPRAFTLGDAPAGVFLRVPRESADELHFGALVRDTARQADDWGTEMPVVRESEFSATRIELLNVPRDARFRQTLRVYGSGSIENRVRILFYSMTSGAQLLEHFATLRSPVPCVAAGPCVSDRPAAAVIGDEVWSQLPQSGRVGVRIESSSGIATWAFVTITNNETQHVTVISPQ